MSTGEMKSIDQTIDNLNQQINEHRQEGRRMQLFAFIMGALLLGAGFSIYLYQEIEASSNNAYLESIISKILATSGETSEAAKNTAKELGALRSKVLESNTSITVIYVFVGVFIVVFGVLMAIYRFHLTEISRAQQQKLGLQRIRIAANNNDKDGFGSEVRESLTYGAFDYTTGKEKKMESPLPGHPTSDFATLFMNKVLDNINIDFKQKNKGA